MPEPSLILEEACVDLAGRRLLSDVHLRIDPGERVAILGANGAGKTTLLRVLHGLQPLSSGRRLGPAPQAQSFLFQRPVLLRRSVAENIRFALGARRLPEAEIELRLQDALSVCQLHDRANQPARALSGGEQQRLALARAWAEDLPILLADEPTASLAPTAVLEIEGLLLELARRAGRTLVLATHNLAQARRLASRIVFLDAGRVLDDCSAGVFFNGPRSVAATAFLEAEAG